MCRVNFRDSDRDLIYIALARLDDDCQPGQLVSPGNAITRDQGYMHGHGTYIDQDVLLASVAGIVERVNKLISVMPVKAMDAVLMLSSGNMPGGT